MCRHARSASGSRRRRKQQRQVAPLPPLVMLDLSKPGERQVHDFLCRATSKRDCMWALISLRRHGDVLLCVVRWINRASVDTPFSLAEVSLSETAVHWRDYASVEGARAEMDRQCSAPTTRNGAT